MVFPSVIKEVHIYSLGNAFVARFAYHILMKFKQKSLLRQRYVGQQNKNSMTNVELNKEREDKRCVTKIDIYNRIVQGNRFFHRTENI